MLLERIFIKRGRIGPKRCAILLYKESETREEKERKIERPKSKNIRHIKVLDAKLEQDAFRSNKALRRALALAGTENSGGN